MSANDAKRTSPSIRLTGLMKRRPRLFRLNVRSLDDLAPLLGLIRDKFFKVGGRTTGHNAPLLCKPRLHIGRRESCIDFLVEPRDDLEFSWARQDQSSNSHRNPTQNRLPSGHPAIPGSASYQSPPVLAAYQLGYIA